MDKRLRPIPFPRGSQARRDELRHLRAIFWFDLPMAIQSVQIANKIARMFPVPGERCGARTRKGTPCQCKALRNGRCKLHGGLSTGAKTPEGKLASLAAINRKPKKR